MQPKGKRTGQVIASGAHDMDLPGPPQTHMEKENSILKAILYHSVAKVAFDEQAIAELISIASTRNHEFQITGYLFLERGEFIQYFEGPAEASDQLLVNICKDIRHEVKCTLVQESLAIRRFPTWRMRLIVPDGMIKMEHVLKQHLAWLGTYRDQNMDSAWRMVDQLSKLQARLADTARG